LVGLVQAQHRLAVPLGAEKAGAVVADPRQGRGGGRRLGILPFEGGEPLPQLIVGGIADDRRRLPVIELVVACEFAPEIGDLLLRRGDGGRGGGDSRQAGQSGEQQGGARAAKPAASSEAQGARGPAGALS
jgi:hypothetical protein